ncbi:MAG: radical SAM protein [Polyangiales bacterium]
MEPERQVEIQLGHMCNNRCVFCVSGQRTAMREAFPVAADPIVEKLREARAQGMEKVTLLGGEPTIQPEFPRVLESAIELGFREIVIFTNGVKTARASFVDEVLATGGNFTWRLSFQGGTPRAHDRTTKKLGSFERLRESLANLRDRGQRITVNMCVVRSNYESVDAFPALLLPYGVTQIHLDMIRPLDAGVRSEEEMRDMLPRYSDMVPALTRMIAGFPAGFDVNIGNLPYCVAPELAPFIHHDGNATLTIAIDNDDDLSEPWDKYETKRRDKVKPPSCKECVFDGQCSGIFDTYRRFYGTDEIVPITRARLPLVDPERRMFTLHAEPLVESLRTRGAEIMVDSHAQRVVATLDGFTIALERPGKGAASTDAFSFHVLGASHFDLAKLRAIFDTLVAASGAHVLHDLAEDAAFHGPARGLANLDPRIGTCLARLRARAPFRELTWRGAQVSEKAASVELLHEGGAAVTISFAVHEGGVRGGYKLDRKLDAPPPGLVEGVRSAMEALRGPG